MDLVSYADLVVELVNAQDPAEDSLKDLEALRRLLTIRPHLTGRVTHRDLDVMRQLRSNLRDIFECATAGELERAAEGVNSLLLQHPIHPALSNHDGSTWHLHLSEDGSVPDRYAAGAAMGLAMLVSERGFEAFKICESPGCQNVYFDTTPDSSRRHCSDGCPKRNGRGQ